MTRLGVDAGWSEDAVAQLAEAAKAVEKYLEEHPDQAETLVRDPQSVLKAAAVAGFITGPVDALEGAMAATREQLARRHEGESGAR